MLNVLTLDVESTIYKYPGDRRSSDRRGSVYSQHNGLVSVCYKWLHEDVVHSMYKDEINTDVLQAALSNAAIVVGFNLKFDLAWLKPVSYTHLTLPTIYSV